MVHLWEVNEPRQWIKPISKVYDLNRISGEFFYKPMVEYIDHKQRSGLDNLPWDQLERPKVQLPSALEASKADISCLSSGSPRFVPFLVNYGAKQLKEKNTLKAHIKHEFARQSKNSDTIDQKRTSVIIRDKYIASVGDMFQEQIRKDRYLAREEERKGCRKYNEENLKYVFSKHAC